MTRTSEQWFIDIKDWRENQGTTSWLVQEILKELASASAKGLADERARVVEECAKAAEAHLDKHDLTTWNAEVRGIAADIRRLASGEEGR